MLVEHMILAHHGKHEFGSPKLPMTPEAMLLSALDDLEAKIQTMRSEFAAASSLDGKSAGEMTEWVRIMERQLLDSSQPFLKRRAGVAHRRRLELLQSAFGPCALTALIQR